MDNSILGGVSPRELTQASQGLTGLNQRCDWLGYLTQDFSEESSVRIGELREHVGSYGKSP